MFPNNFFPTTYFPDNYFGPEELKGGHPGKIQEPEKRRDKSQKTILRTIDTKPPIRVEYDRKSTEELIKSALPSPHKPTLQEKLEPEEDIELLLAIVETFDD